MSKVVPVILAGGAGTRLWPVSRDALPKQFLPLVGERSTYQGTLLRVAAGGGRVVCAADSHAGGEFPLLCPPPARGPRQRCHRRDRANASRFRPGDGGG